MVSKQTPSAENNLLSPEQLADAAGISIDAVRRYIDQELLPEPDQTSGDIPYYEERYVRLIKLIDTFENTYSLPSDIILQTLNEIGYEAALDKSEELAQKLSRAKELPWFERLMDVNSKPFLTRELLMQASDLTEEELEEAINQKLIVPDANGLFTKSDLDVATMLSQLKTNGPDNENILKDFLNMQLQTIESLVENEFDAFFKNIINNKISVEDANEIGEKTLDVLTTLLPICYRQLLSRKLEKLTKSE